MRRLLILVFAAVFTAACCQAGQAAGKKQADVSWAFAVRTDHDGTPHSRVFLRVGGQRVLVASRLTAQFNVVPRQEFKSHQTPAAATAACTGWWAGQGEDFYVIHRHGRLEVFRRDLDEQAPIPAYRRVRSIPLR